MSNGRSDTVVIVQNTAVCVVDDDGRKQWRWKLLVESSSSAVQLDQVTAMLHPTFHPRRHELECRRIQAENGMTVVFESCTFTGWGTFDVDVSILWTDPATGIKHNSSVVHPLVFSQDETHTTRHELQAMGMSDNVAAMLDTTSPMDISSSVVSHSRTHYLQLLANHGYMQPDDPAFWHGRLGYEESIHLEQPKTHWQSTDKPRDDHYDGPSWLTATEYRDEDTTMDWKLNQLADLLRQSRKTILYTGAGISRAAGIGMAARGGNEQVGRPKNLTVTAQPTKTHHALTALWRQGLVHGWVQQNHDGLPQKAGFPQECVNEIHGSWYDPSNPVVLYSGRLKDEECRWMEQQKETADLVLVLGTSLGGLTADDVATRAAKRSKKNKSLGMVIINLQQTPQDDKTSLRIFGESDQVLTALLQKMNIGVPPLLTCKAVLAQHRRVLVPYDGNGKRLAESSGAPHMWWDLVVGAEIVMTPGHNLHGSGQAEYHRIAGKKQPRGVVTAWRDNTCAVYLSMEGSAQMSLGQWWLAAAARGGPTRLPLVNANPEFKYVEGRSI